MSDARHLIARALGVAPGSGSLCASCGATPFDSAGPATRVLGGGFTDFGLLRGSGDTVCLGCQRCLAGRPGDDPPPLRTTSFLVAGGAFTPLRSLDIWTLLEMPPPGEHVVSWAEGRQRHHWLRAGLSTPARQLVGSDHGTIEHLPDRDAPLRHAVLELRRVFPRAAILDGGYSPSAVAAYGVAAWAAHEDVIEPRRSDPLLRLLVETAPRLDPTPAEDTMPIPDTDRDAAGLIALIAHPSRRRRADGLAFWGGFLRHRIARFSRRPLAETVARLLDECDVPAVQAGEVVSALADLTSEAEAGIIRALAERPRLVEALAFQIIKTERAEREAPQQEMFS